MKVMVKLFIMVFCATGSDASFAFAADFNTPAKGVKSLSRDVDEPNQTGGPSGAIFKEDFEDRLTDRGWTISNGDYDYVWDAIAYEGKKSVKIKYVSWIQRTVSTEGYKDIKVKYARKVTNFDEGEELVTGWSPDGTTWNNLEKAADPNWAVKEFALGPEADNNISLRIKFKTNARGEADKYASVDALEITGTATSAKPAPAPAESNKPEK